MEHSETFQFWGTLAPIPQTFRWYNKPVTIEYHLLTGNEEQALVRRRAKLPEDEQIIEEGLLRLAYAVLTVNGVATPAGFEDRLREIREWPGPLLDAALLAYDDACKEPFRALEELVDDPNSEAGPTPNG